jgi:hypothetical protein
MENYKPNSYKSKEENLPATTESKKAQKVVSGTVRAKKRNEAQKLADVFISEDASKVKSYIVEDVLIPTIKKTIYDIFTESLAMIFGFGPGRGKSSTSSSKISYVSYDKFSSSKPNRGPVTKSTYSYDDITLESRGDAEAVLIQMDELLDKYQMVSVADFYDCVGVAGNYTDNKYGWTDLRNAQVIRTREGYKIKLPRAYPLD